MAPPRPPAAAGPPGGGVRRQTLSPAAATARGRLGRVGQREQLGIRLAIREWFPTSGNLADGACQDDRPFELPFIGGEIRLGLGVKVNDRRHERALDAGRPGLGKADQGDALRLDDLRREPFERPAAPNGPHASRWALAAPHAASLSRVHSLARFMLGEPVSRGPMTSVR